MNQNDKIKIITKSLLVVFLFCLCINQMIDTAESNQELAITEDNRSVIPSCDSYLNRGEYNELMDTLVRYDTRDEIFDVYWEIADCYQALMEYRVWTKAVEEGADSDGFYAEQANACRSKIEIIRKESKFPANQKVLENMLQDIL